MYVPIEALLAKHNVPYPRCGADVGDGWLPLVDQLMADLIAAGWDRDCHQIKEKFGGLRFYVGGTTDEIDRLIGVAETASTRICEACGAPGSRRGRGRIQTLCDTHAGGRQR